MTDPIRDYIRTLPLPNVLAIRQSLTDDAKHLTTKTNRYRFGQKADRDMKIADYLLALAGQSQSIASVAGKVAKARTDKRRAWSVGRYD